MAKKKIAFVCVGNTCRSAMAQFVLKKMLKNSNFENVLVSSFGLSVCELSMNEKARISLKNHGFRLSKFTPKQIDEKALKTYDALICMTDEIKENLPRQNNVYSMNDLCKLGDVLDPYSCPQEVYDKTLEQIINCCEKIMLLLEEVLAN